MQPSLVEDVQGVSAVACGPTHSAFIADGVLHTGGSNSHGQLGWDESEQTGTSSSSSCPGFRTVTLEAEDGYCPSALSVSLGGYHSAVITEGGALWTFGWGGSFWGGAGALGLGTSESRPRPTLVSLFVEYQEEAQQVACGDVHTMVLTADGRLYSAGKGEHGRLGRGDIDDSLEFEEMDFFFHSNDSVLNPSGGATRIVKIDCGDNFSGALSQDGELWIWGRNDYGQLGQGVEACLSSSASSSYPRLIRTLPLEGHRIVDFECGRHHLVALTSAGVIYEWGNRKHLEPCPLTLPSRYEAGIKNLQRVVAGDGISFALTAEGRVYAWGLPGGEATWPTLLPEETFGGRPVLQLAAGPRECLAIVAE